MFRDITLRDLMALHAKEPHTMIDVRSPKEFAEASIPGALNIPLFNDEERAEVGTIYKQVGQAEAKKEDSQFSLKSYLHLLLNFKRSTRR